MLWFVFVGELLLILSVRHKVVATSDDLHLVANGPLLNHFLSIRESLLCQGFEIECIFYFASSSLAIDFMIAEPGPWQNYRLPSFIIPSVYDLLLHPNMTTDDYTGRNAMTLTITEVRFYLTGFF